MDRQFACETMRSEGTVTLREILERLRPPIAGRSACSSCTSTTSRPRVAAGADGESPATASAAPKQQVRILKRLTDAVIFEEFLRKKFMGDKIFSLEGAETLIPLLDMAIEKAGNEGVREIVIGMAHRGRLNVLANILDKSPRQIFREFDDKDPDLRSAAAT